MILSTVSIKRFLFLGAILISACCCLQGQATHPQPCTLSTGQTCKIGNGNLAYGITLNEQPTGSPASVSVTIQGCLSSATTDTCDTAANTCASGSSPSNCTNVSTSAALQKVVATTPYDYFLVTATLSGGTSPTIVVTPAVSTANAHSGAAGGAVSSVFTRTGAVVAAGGDYTCAQVTNCGSNSFPVTVAGTVTSGGIPYFNSTTSESSSAALTANGVVLGGGAGAAPTVTVADATTTHALFATAGAPAFRAIAAGDIPVAIPIGNIGSAGLTGTAPATISAAGAIGCATCVVNNGANTGTSAMTLDLSANTSTTGFKVPTTTTNTATAASVIDYDSTNGAFHMGVNAADSLAMNETNGVTANLVLKSANATRGTASGSSITDNGTFISTAEVVNTGNTVKLVADTSGITATTAGTATTVFTLPALKASTVYAVHCSGTTTQATAGGGLGMSVTFATTAPTQAELHAMVATSLTALNAGATQLTTGNITTTTATAIYSSTSGTLTTQLPFYIDGTIEVGATPPASTVIGFFSASASDAVVVKRDSYCSVLP